jgi:ADP-heptose:LPS heptosyltransferase
VPFVPYRILIPLFGDVGDTLLTVPALRAIRRRYPSARIVVVGKDGAASILSDLGLADRVIRVDKHLFDRPMSLLSPWAWARALLLIRQIRSERPEVAVLFHHLVSRWGAMKFALLVLSSGAPQRIGVDNGRGWFLTEAVRDEGFGAFHEAEYWLQVARLIDADGALTLEAPISDADRVEAERLLRDAGVRNGNLLVVHPGTGWYGPGRRWPVQSFAAAVSLIVDKRAMTCVVVGTGQDQNEADELASLLGKRAVNLCTKTSLGELGAILEGSQLVLANDGGVSHLAAAAGARVVTVFGPSNDRAWAPIGGTVVTADLPCRPCFYRDFSTGLRRGCRTRECLPAVTPERAAAVALALLTEERIAV